MLVRTPPPSAWSRNVIPALENVVLEHTVLNDAKTRAAKPREKAYKLTDSHSFICW
jgi:hypothetical protein